MPTFAAIRSRSVPNASASRRRIDMRGSDYGGLRPLSGAPGDPCGIRHLPSPPHVYFRVSRAAAPGRLPFRIPITGVPMRRFAAVRPIAALLLAFLATRPVSAAEKDSPRKSEGKPKETGKETGKDEKKKEEKGPWKGETFAGLELRPLGPALTSGRIVDVAVDPSDKSTWYVASASGGVWKTENAGTTW